MLKGAKFSVFYLTCSDLNWKYIKLYVGNWQDNPTTYVWAKNATNSGKFSTSSDKYF